VIAITLPLSHGDNSTKMDGQKMIILANRGLTGKKMGKLMEAFPLARFPAIL